jgi:hypothetical protein
MNLFLILLTCLFYIDNHGLSAHARTNDVPTKDTKKILKKTAKKSSSLLNKKKQNTKFSKKRTLKKLQKKTPSMSKKNPNGGVSKKKVTKKSNSQTKKKTPPKKATTPSKNKKTEPNEIELPRAQLKEFATFLKTPFQKQVKQRHSMVTFNACNFAIADLGYTGQKARTDQYQVVHPMLGDMTLNLPTAPVFHPYDPNNNTDVYTKPSYSLNVKAPKFYNWLAPTAVTTHLKRFGILESNVDFFIEVQDMPWDGVPLLLRPQYWLSPNEPTQRPEYYSKSFDVYTGVFHVMGGNNILLDSQTAGQLIRENRISVHNTARVVADNAVLNADGSIVVADRSLISSSNTLAVQNLNCDVSSVLYSLTIHQNRAAVVKHVMLNQRDHDVFQEILTASANMYDVRDGMVRAKARFSNPSLVDEF